MPDQPNPNANKATESAKVDTAPEPKAVEPEAKKGSKEDGEREVNPPTHGPGSTTRWDDPDNAPHKRFSVAQDPTGEKNRDRATKKK